jgi:predicted metal-binding protein
MIRITNISVKSLELYFKESVRVACEKCPRYGTKVTCPPLLPSVSSCKNNLLKYQHCTLIIRKYIITDHTQEYYKEIGKRSSLELVNDLETFVNNSDIKSYILFGAGSCKKCQVCNPSKENCIIPLEATGLNILKYVRDYKIIPDIQYPVKDYFYRIGAIFYNGI